MYTTPPMMVSTICSSTDAVVVGFDFIQRLLALRRVDPGFDLFLIPSVKQKLFVIARLAESVAEIMPSHFSTAGSKVLGILLLSSGNLNGFEPLLKTDIEMGLNVTSNALPDISAMYSSSATSSNEASVMR
ncbi:MAG TPA: hypothetical protein H9845_01685 [Candidatus Agathobaculum pullicola]|nr:hypothetical protein [Candidatus Agathobaculum pullicola]